jgi:hypothetical protein
MFGGSKLFIFVLLRIFPDLSKQIGKLLLYLSFSEVMRSRNLAHYFYNHLICIPLFPGISSLGPSYVYTWLQTSTAVLGSYWYVQVSTSTKSSTCTCVKMLFKVVVC